MYELEPDLAKNTFVGKWPSWFRWIIFIPTAIVAPLVIYGILSFTYKAYYGFDEKSLVLDLMGDFWIGAGFVAIGAIIAPRKQFFIALILFIFITILAVLNATLWMPQAGISFSNALIHATIVIASGAYVVYMFHNQVGKR